MARPFQELLIYKSKFQRISERDRNVARFPTARLNSSFKCICMASKYFLMRRGRCNSKGLCAIQPSSLKELKIRGKESKCLLEIFTCQEGRIPSCLVWSRDCSKAALGTLTMVRVFTESAVLTIGWHCGPHQELAPSSLPGPIQVLPL